jgi:hypothetical protein
LGRRWFEDAVAVAEADSREGSTEAWLADWMDESE